MTRPSGRRRPQVDVRAALRGEIEQALALLQKRRLSDESVHGVRQALKRARAALRLLHDAVPEAAYARENTALRDAARPLASARDACVKLRLVDEMIAARKMRPYRPVLVRLRARLREAHARCLAAAGAHRRLRSMRRQLEQSLERTAHWRLPRDARPVYLGGLRRIYERGQRGLETVRARGSVSALHEWRKQVKYLGVAMAVLGGGRPRDAKPYRLAVEAAKQLGDDHDLAALAAILRRMRADADLIAKLEQRRSKLQKRALRRGRQLYKPAPERFARRGAKR